ncbi:hypothetical protein M2S89_14995, partial [Klebsiella pneumoniae]|nr:hypothetical protein [Klebsiella pneumoniae]
MTITETQKTAQLAADAAVSAAEAKQYMLEAEQGYQDTSAAAQQAQDAAGSALLSKQSAATSEENSLQYATEAGVARDEAVTAASNASEYAQNKFTFYKTASDPDGTIAGLAATTDGQSFWVAQGPDALSAAWQYQNKAGVAVLQAKQPGTAAITGTIREFPTLAAAQADADAGNIPVGSTAFYRSPDDSALAIEVINNAGTLTTTGRKIPSYSFVEKLPTLGKSGDHPNLVNFDDNDLEVGKRLSVTTGLTGPLAGYNTTGWIPVTPGQQLVFSVLGEIVDFYSSSRAFLSGASQATRYVTVPTGAAWMRASYQQSSVYWIVTGAVLPASVSPFGLVVRPDRIQSVPLAALPVITPEYLRTFQKSGTNLFNKNSRMQGYYISAAGVAVASASYDASDMISVEAGKTYTANAAMRFVTMYGAGGAPVMESGITANTTTFTVPAGISGVRVSIAVASVDTFALSEGSTAPVYTEFKWIAPSSLPDGTPVEYMPKISDGAVSRAMIASEAISPDKTNLFTASKNIFLADTVTDGYYVNNNTG